MAIDSNYYKKKQGKSLFLSLGFFIFVIIMTGGIFAYNSYLSSQNQELDSQIAQREASIEELRKDKNIEAYNVYVLNQEILQRLGDRSDIPAFVEHALRTMIRYDLTFSEFSYENGELKLNAEAESSDSGLAYTKIVKFLSEYNVNEASLFTLAPIESFAGQDNIKFPIMMKLK